MTQNEYDQLYADLISHIEHYERNGKRISRYGAVRILTCLVPAIDGAMLDLIDRLYADAFVSA